MTVWADTGTIGHSAQASVGIATPTDDPITLTKAARALIPKVSPVDGIRYARADVVLTDLRQANGVQPLDLFRPEFEGRGAGQALDQINRKLATIAVGVGLGGTKAPSGWEMKREMLSPRCLTKWDDLLVAAAYGDVVARFSALVSDADELFPRLL